VPLIQTSTDAFAQKTFPPRSTQGWLGSGCAQATVIPFCDLVLLYPHSCNERQIRLPFRLNGVAALSPIRNCSGGRLGNSPAACAQLPSTLDWYRLIRHSQTMAQGYACFSAACANFNEEWEMTLLKTHGQGMLNCHAEIRCNRCTACRPRQDNQHSLTRSAHRPG